MTDKMDGLDFAVAHDAPIPYLHRISTYYRTLGYGKPYRWAQYADVPFAPLRKPLSESRISLASGLKVK